MINRICHKHTPQQIRRHFLILLLTLYQLTGNSNDSGLLQCRFILRIFSCAYTGQRKKCCTSETVLLQKCNHFLCRCFIFRHNILNVSTQSGLNRNLIFLIHLNQI